MRPEVFAVRKVHKPQRKRSVVRSTITIAPSYHHNTMQSTRRSARFRLSINRAGRLMVSVIRTRNGRRGYGHAVLCDSRYGFSYS